MTNSGRKGDGIHLMVEGEVFAWNPMRGIPRVYREILPRLGSVDPDLHVTVGVQGSVRSDALRNTGIRLVCVPGLPASLRPWRVWSRVVPMINSRLAAGYWRRQKADVFHATHYGLPHALRPSLCVVFDMIPELFPERFALEDARAIRAAKRRAVRHADKVLCISENTRRDVVRVLNVPAERCEVLPLAGLSGSRLDEKSRTFPSVQGRFLLYVGGYRAAYKNFDFLIEALAALGSNGVATGTLVVASPERPGDKELIAFDRRLGAGRVRFISRCSDAHLVHLYQTCSALVMPSLYEGFGLPVLEALSCGTPVACSDAASLPEVGGDVVRYFKPDSVRSFNEAVTAALAEGRRPDCVARRQSWGNRFTWERSAQYFASAVRAAAGASCKRAAGLRSA